MEVKTLMKILYVIQVGLGLKDQQGYTKDIAYRSIVVTCKPCRLAFDKFN